MSSPCLLCIFTKGTIYKCPYDVTAATFLVSFSRLPYTKKHCYVIQEENKEKNIEVPRKFEISLIARNLAPVLKRESKSEKRNSSLKTFHGTGLQIL